MTIKRVGHTVKIKTGIVNNYEKIVHPSFKGETKEKEFLILSCPNDTNDFYTVLVEDHMLGWIIDLTHITYNNINKRFLGKKFFDVNEEYFID